MLSITNSQNIIGNSQAYGDWTQSTDQDFNGGILNNLTILNEGDNAKLKLLSSNWIEKPQNIKPDKTEKLEMSSILGTDKTVLFGYNQE